MTNPTYERRRRDVEALRAVIDNEVDEASRALMQIGHAGDSIWQQDSSAAGLDMLRAVSESSRAMQEATRELALALSERGEQTSRIARAAGVNRVTVNRWKNDRDKRSRDKQAESMPVEDPSEPS